MKLLFKLYLRNLNILLKIIILFSFGVSPILLALHFRKEEFLLLYILTLPFSCAFFEVNYNKLMNEE